MGVFSSKAKLPVTDAVAAPIQISSAVMDRLKTIENDSNKQTEGEYCGTCHRKINIENIDNEDISQLLVLKNASSDQLARKASVIEEQQYVKTMEKMDNLFGKQIHWNEKYDEMLNDMRANIIKCFKDNPTEPLCCSDLAKRYTDFVYRAQCETMSSVSNNAEAGGNEERALNSIATDI